MDPLLLKNNAQTGRVGHTSLPWLRTVCYQCFILIFIFILNPLQ